MDQKHASVYFNTHRPTVLLDVDNTLLTCTEIACELFAEEHPDQDPIKETDVKAYGVTGERSDLLLPYYARSEVYLRQQPYPGARQFVADLCRMYEVYLLTALPVRFHELRDRQIRDFFPDIPRDHVFYGDAKTSFVADFSLDDADGHILGQYRTGCVRFPVLYRRPWNEHITGVLAANDYRDFLTIVATSVKGPMTSMGRPDVVVFVGPSGSGKNDLADYCANRLGFARIRSCTTFRGADPSRYDSVTEEEFRRLAFEGKLAEVTCYGGCLYGIRTPELTVSSEVKVAVLDIAGAIRLKSIFKDRCLTCYVHRRDEILFKELLARKDLLPDKLIWLEIEKKNRELLDVTIENDDFERASRDLAKFLEDLGRKSR